MRRNVGSVDALVRGLLAVALAVLGVSVHERGLLSFVAILVALVLMATALTRECPLYRLLHLGTLRASNPMSRARRG